MLPFASIVMFDSSLPMVLVIDISTEQGSNEECQQKAGVRLKQFLREE